ncbi:heavy-metal-associated domain-containing protein [Phthorimaea operculella]|nr:heavy-metal-associated domain-containing protein [Phthorimaea operculella]
MSSTHIFNVEMTCEGCSGAVERVLNRLKGEGGVESVNISLPEQKVSVTSTLDADKLLDVIKKTGKKTTYVGKQ